MTTTPVTLTRAAGVAAALAGLVFIGVQIGHPHVDVTSITTTEVIVRNTFKVVMAALALIGITGMYLRQVRQSGVLGLVGYLLLGTGYLLIVATGVVSAYVLPSIAESDPAYVADVLAVFTGRPPTGDIGLLQQVNQVQGVGYLLGGLVLGIAMYRARVLARWAAALLAVGAVVTVALSVLPDAFYRLLAFPNGVAMIALGYSLWRAARIESPPAVVHSTRVPTAGA